MARPPGADHESRATRPVHDPGDAWVVSPTGEKFWGRFGAAGLLAHDVAQGVLLQHRAQWSHFGGTWGIPGGALQVGEHAILAALREANEEAGVPSDSVQVRATRVIDRQVWTYTTVIADVVRPFTPVVGDAESVELAWVPIDQVTERPLHPAFETAWPALSKLLAQPPLAVVVDAANVVGSVPNGWWRDRQAATHKFIDQLADIAKEGLPATAVGLDASRWHATVDVVVEGSARGVQMPVSQNIAVGQPLTSGKLKVTTASTSGDDAIVARARAYLVDRTRVIVVTSDRELQARVTAIGAEYRGASWLLKLLPGAEDRSP